MDFDVINRTHTRNDLYKRIAELEAKLPPVEFSIDGSPETMDNSLEIVVGGLVNEWLAGKEIKKMLKTLTYTDGKDIYQVKTPATAQNIEAIKRQNWWKDSYIILNALEFGEAFELIKQISEDTSCTH